MSFAPFPIDAELTSLVIAYSNGKMIADNVFPILPSVGKEEYEYWKFDFTESYTIPDTLVGRKSAPNEVEFSAQKVTSSTKDYGLEDPIPLKDIENARGSGYDPIQHAAVGLADLLILDRELRVANIAFNPANYGSNTMPLTGASRFDHPDSNPIDIMHGIMDDMLVRPNCMAIGRRDWSALTRNPAVLRAYHGADSDKGRAPMEFIKDVLELEEIYVGEAWVNNARRGQTPSKARAWGGSCLLFVKDKMANPVVSGARSTFAFTQPFRDRIAGQTPDPNIGLYGGVRIRVGWSLDEKIAAADLGFLLTTVTG
jgi:hypothetical protein